MSLTGLPLLVLLTMLSVGGIGVAVWRRGWQRALAVVMAAVTLLLGTGAIVNRHFQYLTSWSDLFGIHSRDLVALGHGQTLAQALNGVAGQAAVAFGTGGGASWATSPDHGTMVQLQLPGPLSGINRSGYVYLPPQYFSPAYAQTRFPVVELFHGSPGTPADWVRLRADLAEDAELLARRAGPMIFVLPDSNGGLLSSSECVNADGGKQVETYLTRDVPAFVRAHFRTTGKWGAIGYSTGGFCAVNLAMRNPSVYSAAVGLDGNYWAIQDNYTGHLYANWQQRMANSPIYEAQHGAGANQAFYLLTGKHDESQAETLALARALNVHAPDVLVDQRRGRHTFRDWRQAMGQVLDWMWARLATPTMRHDFPVSGQFAVVGAGTWFPSHRHHHTYTVAVARRSSPPSPRPASSPTRTPTRSPSPSPTPSPVVG